MDTDTKHGSSRAVERFMELWNNGNTSPLSWELCKHGLGYPPAIFNAAAIVYTQSPENMVNFLEWAYKVADRLAACNAREDEYMVEIERLREQARLRGALTQTASCVGKIEVRRGDDCEIYLTLTEGGENGDG